MQQLPEIQAHFRDAVVSGETNGISPALIGGRYPEKRLAIHQRNYHSSLTDALLTKFPATEWLLGTRFLSEAAGGFIRECPPHVPCIAEYGIEFPDFLGQRTPHLPYVRDFAQLEWSVGKAAIAVDQPPVDVTIFAEIDSLPDTSVTLQTGVHYLHASWPIDELLTAYLTESAPARGGDRAGASEVPRRFAHELPHGRAKRRGTSDSSPVTRRSDQAQRSISNKAAREFYGVSLDKVPAAPEHACNNVW